MRLITFFPGFCRKPGLIGIFLLCIVSLFGQESIKKDTLKIAYYNAPPFVENNSDGKLTGISIWLWDAIAQEMDVPYTMEYVPLNDVMGKLKDGSIDLCLNPLTVTSERLKLATFSYPFYVSNSAAVTKEVSNFQKGKQFLASFFSVNFFSAVFALFFIILIFGLLVWIFERKRNPDQFSPRPHGIMSGIWWSAVTMTTVGYGDKSPQTFWGRTIALIWMFTAVIILSSFTASIASSLTVNHLQWDKNSISDYKDSRVGVIAGSATEDWLRRRFFTKIKTFQTIPEGLDALKNKKLDAFLHDEPILRYYLKNDDYEGKIEILNAKFNLQFYSFGISKSLNDEVKNKIIITLSNITEGSDWQMLLSEYDLTLQ